MAGGRKRLSRATAALAATTGLATTGSANPASDLAFGEYLAGECVTCHKRTGKVDGIPAITGWPKDSFVAVLRSYKSKERDNLVMQTIAGRLQDDEMNALAAYFETLGESEAKSK